MTTQAFQIWTEKYRPQELKHVIENEDVISIFNSFSSKKNFPHLLISGPSGSGRLTAVLSLLREIYGDSFGLNTFYLNATDDKTYYQEYLDYWYELIKIELKKAKGYAKEPSNLDLLHGFIKLFARKKSLDKTSFRTLIINEAEKLTKMTQQALRRIMERNVRNFRIILISESISKIIDPIRSRCMILNFNKFSDESLMRIINMIAKEEKFQISNEAMSGIIYLSKNNLKKVINFLQAAASVSDSIDLDLIYDIHSKISAKTKLKNIVKACMFSNFRKIRDTVRSLFIEHGYSGRKIIQELADEFLLLPYPESIKVKFFSFLAEADARLSSASSEELYIYNTLAKISRYFIEDLQKIAEE